MPRRPRSTSRAAPKNKIVNAAARASDDIKTFPKTSKPKTPVSSSEADESEQEDGDPEEGSDEEAESSEEAAALEDDEDVDAPRISQWVDDDDLDPNVYQSDEETPEDRNAAGPSQLADVSDSESEDSEDEKPEAVSLKGKEKEKPEWSIQPRHDIAKRAHKHAPVEVTSKRPVTRRRTVVEVKTIQPRDPRFLPLAGEFSPQKFQEQYGFLADAHKTELRTLRENLKAARKLLVSSPRDLRADREAEVSRLEMAVKRAESMVNKDRRAKVDQEALTKLNEAERAKRKEGKGEWWMKEADKKQFLVRARYDALAAEGGKRAVKKAIEKKQKKIGQKEKKSRPFAKGSGLKRKPPGDNDGGPPQKRHKS
ncbi:DUF947-domain-containing protein [Mycena metata]|uniref:rRNA biogenesis protein RRP36 n=1 Tax=Mycena metata TaxID=1033252 RepID=A0AAD7P2U5_9AGAR|nr:DUF947-domain-containing protein [Mycena metata]